MAFEPTERLTLGRTGLSVTRLGFGGASIGGLFAAVDDDDAIATVAPRLGPRGPATFDVAPLYGYGAARATDRARRSPTGRATSSSSRRRSAGSSAPRRIPPDADVDRQALDGRDDAFYVRTAGRPASSSTTAPTASAARSRRASSGSASTGSTSPSSTTPTTIGRRPSARPTRRSTGCASEGTDPRRSAPGMNQSAMLARFAREGDFDVFLLAGRYTLLDQDALPTLLPLCVERGIAILVGGVMNSGVLADPRPGSRFDYRPAPPDGRRARPPARRRSATRHGVPLRAAAIQFPLAHPAVAVARSPASAGRPSRRVPGADAAADPRRPLGGAAAEGLIAAEAPVPADHAVIVDAHHHFWDPAGADYPWLTDELAAIRRPFGPTTSRRCSTAAGIDATILVQTRSSLEETREFLATAPPTPFVRGRRRLGRPDRPRRRRHHRRAPRRPGRRSPRRDPPPGPRRARPDWLLRDDVRRGIARRRRGGPRLRPARPAARAAGRARARRGAARRPVRHRPSRQAADPRRRAAAVGGPVAAVRRARRTSRARSPAW